MSKKHDSIEKVSQSSTSFIKDSVSEESQIKSIRHIGSRLPDLSLLDEEDRFEEFNTEEWRTVIESISTVKYNSDKFSSRGRYWEDDWKNVHDDENFADMLGIEKDKILIV